MKVLCIDNKNIILSVTIGEWYDVLEEDETSYLLDNDHGYPKKIDKKKFLTLEQLREQKINFLEI
jgi:hypothetical protein